MTRNVIPPEVVNDINELLNTLNNVNANTDDVEDKLDNVISELQDIEVDVESVDVNTDDVETKLDTVISELQDVEVDTEANTSELQDINTELDSINSFIDAIENTVKDDGVPADDTGVPPHLRVHNGGIQPDDDLAFDRASGVVDSFNDSLNADEEVTVNGFTDSDGWATIELFISSDQQSALQGVKVDYTDDVQGSQDVLATRTKTFTSESVDKGYETFKFETDLDGFRVRYKNGSTAASDVDIITTLRTSSSPDAANYVDKNTLGDNFVRVGTSAEESGLKIGDPASLFGDLETIERTTLLDVSSSFGTSTLRDETDSTNSGSLVEDPNDNGEIILSTGATANSTVDLRTAAYGRYTPGYSAQAGMGIRLSSLWTEGEGRWGYFGDTNDSGSGFYFGYDGDQQETFIGRLVLGVEVDRVYKSNWNGQDIDSILDKDFDPREGYIYQIDFSWYGYGIINFYIVGQTIDTTSGRTPRQETVTVHSLVVENETSIPDPNEPIRVELENGSNGDDNRLAVGGRQFSVFGTVSQEYRITSETVFDSAFDNGSWTYIMSWQRRDAGTDANARLDVQSLDISVDQTSKYALVINANLSGTNYNDPSLTPSDETLLEVSTTGSFDGIGTGRKVWESSTEVGTGNNAFSGEAQDVDVDFGQNGEVTLLAFGDGGAGEMTTTMRLQEDW